MAITNFLWCNHAWIAESSPRDIIDPKMWIRRTTPSREIASVPDDRIVMGVDTYRHAQTHTHTAHICVQTPEKVGKSGSRFFKNKADFIEKESGCETLRTRWVRGELDFPATRINAGLIGTARGRNSVYSLNTQNRWNHKILRPKRKNTNPRKFCNIFHHELARKEQENKRLINIFLEIRIKMSGLTQRTVSNYMSLKIVWIVYTHVCTHRCHKANIRGGGKTIHAVCGVTPAPILWIFHAKTT